VLFSLSESDDEKENIKMDKIPGQPEQTHKGFLESFVSKEKRVAVGRDAKWTAIAIALITLVGQQIILNTKNIKILYSPLENYLKPGVASLGDYITIGNTFMLSAPVILAFAIIFVYAYVRIQKQEGFAPGHFFVGAGFLYFAALIGNTLGFAPVRTAGLRPGNPYATMAIILGDLYNSYGFILFFSSIVVGIFIARAWNILATD